jgi:hypothetical protein
MLYVITLLFISSVIYIFIRLFQSKNYVVLLYVETGFDCWHFHSHFNDSALCQYKKIHEINNFQRVSLFLLTVVEPIITKPMINWPLF